jgi:glycosyltransferase involved in cell wall biosynthesis
MKSEYYIIGSTAHSLINFRFDLIKSLSKKNNVSVLSQDYNEKIFKEFNKIGVNYFSYGKKSFFLINELISFIFIFNFLLKKKNIRILSYTLRGNVYVGLVSLFNKDMKHFPMITGLGGIFLSKDENLFTFIMFCLFKLLLKISLLKSEKIIFQNNHDKIFFNQTIIKKKSIIIPGSGVNHRFYRKEVLPEKITFMMISRIIKNKGIENFLTLSKEIYKINKNIKFIFVGQYQKNFSLEKKFSTLLKESRNVKFIKWKKNAKNLYKRCSVYILPSKREGMSRTILEAMSSGRAIITTNVPGCKETVKVGYNGYLVKYNDNDSLFRAANIFIKNPKLIKKFGINSRKRSIKLFNIDFVNNKIIKLLTQ